MPESEEYDSFFKGGYMKSRYNKAYVKAKEEYFINQGKKLVVGMEDAVTLTEEGFFKLGQRIENIKKDAESDGWDNCVVHYYGFCGVLRDPE